jgi:hypothetical protein
MAMYTFVPPFRKAYAVMCLWQIKVCHGWKKVCRTLPYMNELNVNNMWKTFLSTISETYNGLGLRGRLLVGWWTSEVICLAVSGTSERQYHGIITG